MSQMLRWVSILILAPAVLSLAGCGGGSSPAAPRPVAAPTPTPAPTPVPPPVALDGLTHEAVAAEITPAAPGLREAVTLRAPGFLLREQRYDGGPIHLWKVEEDYVNAVVYSLTFTDGSFRMVRWAGPFTVTLEQGLEGNDTVMRKTRDVMAEVTRCTGLPIAIGPNGAVRVVIDGAILSNDNAVGQAIRTSRARTSWAPRSSSRPSPTCWARTRPTTRTCTSTRCEIMTPGGASRTTLGEFQPREALALHMMYQHRLAGNRPPDKDGALFTQSAARPIVTVIND